MSTETTTIETESQSARDFNWETQRIWKVINPNKVNRHGTNTAYKLVPGAAIPPLLDSSSPSTSCGTFPAWWSGPRIMPGL
jgi:primary-amine oxidase